eukprot:g1294.t1
MKQIRLSGMDEKERKLATKEVQILAKIRSRHVVRYYDSFAEDAVLSIIMEHCARGDLQQFLKTQKKPLPEADVLRIGVQIAAGLADIHRQRIIHRDVKTANVFICKNGRLKIGDLGVARLLGTKSSLAKTMVGTPYYFSPELCENRPYNYKSDMYALGCIMYECCTLRHPFTANNQCALIFRIMNATIRPLSTSRYSSGTRQLVMSLLLREARKRPSAQEILRYHGVRRTVNELSISPQSHISDDDDDDDDDGGGGDKKDTPSDFAARQRRQRIPPPRKGRSDHSRVRGGRHRFAAHRFGARSRIQGSASCGGGDGNGNRSLSERDDAKSETTRSQLLVPARSSNKKKCTRPKGDCASVSKVEDHKRGDVSDREDGNDVIYISDCSSEESSLFYETAQLMAISTTGDVEYGNNGEEEMGEDRVSSATVSPLSNDERGGSCLEKSTDPIARSATTNAELEWSIRDDLNTVEIAEIEKVPHDGVDDDDDEFSSTRISWEVTQVDEEDERLENSVDVDDGGDDDGDDDDDDVVFASSVTNDSRIEASTIGHVTIDNVELETEVLNSRVQALCLHIDRARARCRGLYSENDGGDEAFKKAYESLKEDENSSIKLLAADCCDVAFTDAFERGTRIYVLGQTPFISTDGDIVERFDEESLVCFRSEYIPTSTFYVGNARIVEDLYRSIEDSHMEDGDYEAYVDSNRWFLSLESTARNQSVRLAELVQSSFASFEIVTDSASTLTSSPILDNNVQLALYIVGGALVISTVAVGLYVRRRKRNKLDRDLKRFSFEIKSKGEALSVVKRDADLQKKAWTVSWNEIDVEAKSIARGAYGKVYKGTMHGKFSVAVKVILEDDVIEASDDAEIAFLMKARHPRLVWFMGCGKNDDGHAFLVLEYMECGSLDDLAWSAKPGTAAAVAAATSPTLTWDVRSTLLGDVAAGMKYLHGKLDSIHRDLKTPNVLLSRERNRLRAKVADFGLSKMLNRKSATKAPITPRRSKRRSTAWSSVSSHFRRSIFGSGKINKPSSVKSGHRSRTSTATSVSSIGSFESASSRKSSAAEENSCVSPDIVSTTNLSRTSSNSASHSNMVMTTKIGTANWLSPELAKHILDKSLVAPYSQAIDVYAFGIIMWELLELSAPWKELSFSSHILRRVAAGERPHVSHKTVNAAPLQYVARMQRCWAQDPLDRPDFDEIASFFPSRSSNGDVLREATKRSEDEGICEGEPVLDL